MVFFCSVLATNKRINKSRNQEFRKSNKSKQEPKENFQAPLKVTSSKRLTGRCENHFYPSTFIYKQGLEFYCGLAAGRKGKTTIFWNEGYLFRGM